VVAGVDSQLVCHATGARPAATIIWLKDGAKVTAAETVASPGEGKLMNSVSRLTVRPSLDDQGKTYSCQAANDAALRQATADVTLNVLCKFLFLIYRSIRIFLLKTKQKNNVSLFTI
jgi:hypothetical protein